MTATALATPAQATFPDSDRTATTGGSSRNSTSSPTGIAPPPPAVAAATALGPRPQPPAHHHLSRPAITGRGIGVPGIAAC
jgi:hypothetical protein